MSREGLRVDNRHDAVGLGLRALRGTANTQLPGLSTPRPFVPWLPTSQPPGPPHPLAPTSPSRHSWSPPRDPPQSPSFSSSQHPLPDPILVSIPRSPPPWSPGSGRPGPHSPSWAHNVAAATCCRDNSREWNTETPEAARSLPERTGNGRRVGSCAEPGTPRAPGRPEAAMRTGPQLGRGGGSRTPAWGPNVPGELRAGPWGLRAHTAGGRVIAARAEPRGPGCCGRPKALPQTQASRRRPSGAKETALLTHPSTRRRPIAARGPAPLAAV